MNPLLIATLIAGVLGFGGAWQWQGYRMDAYKLEQKNEQLANQRAAAQALAEAQAKVTAAQAAAQVAADRVRRDAAGAAVAGVGMRDALASAVRAAATDLQTCTGQVSTISELLSASSTAYGELALEADQWAGQAVTLQAAWPK